MVTGKNQRMIIIFSCRNVLIYHSVQDRQRTHRSVIKRLGWCQDLSLGHPSSTHPASRLAVRPWPPIGQFSLTSVTLGQSEHTWRPIGRGRGEWLRNFPLADQFCGQFWANKENSLRRSWKLQHRDPMVIYTQTSGANKSECDFIINKRFILDSFFDAWNWYSLFPYQ